MKLALRGKIPPTYNCIVFEMLSERYGWTPQEIKKQDWRDIQDYLLIINTKNNIQKFNELKNKHGR